MPPEPRPPASKPTEPEPASLDPVAVLKALLGLERLTGIYPSGHPVVEDKLKELEAPLQQHLQTNAAARIDIVRGMVHLNGLPFPQAIEPRLLDELVTLGIDSVYILQGLESEDLRRLAHVLRDMHRGRALDRPVDAMLVEQAVRHISLGRLVPLDTRWQLRQWPDAPTGPIDPEYAHSLQLAQSTFEEVGAGGRLSATAVHELTRQLVSRVASSGRTIAQVLAIKQYENLTYCHSVNVALLTLLLARQLDLDETTTTALVEAALLHDIGKTKIPLDIVKKPGALDKRERRLIQAHTVFGAEILVEIGNLHALAPTIALEHHRTVTGGGYPDLGRGAVPHVMSQIVSVADVYEAVTGARSYREPMRPEQACLLLARMAGEALNTALVKSFINAVTFFPVGSLVRTTSQEVGVVVRTNPADALHPVVALVDEQIRRVIGEVDTSERDATGCHVRHIAGTLPPPADDLDLPSLLAGRPAAMLAAGGRA
jgi:putative nucleotidyltransferase with HDIG domain